MPESKTEPFTVDEIVQLRGKTQSIMERALFDVAVDTGWSLERILQLDWSNVRLADESDEVYEWSNSGDRGTLLYQAGVTLRILSTLYRPLEEEAVFVDTLGNRLGLSNARKIFRRLGEKADLGGSVYRRLMKSVEDYRDKIRKNMVCPRCGATVGISDRDCQTCFRMLDDDLRERLQKDIAIRERRAAYFDEAFETSLMAKKWLGYLLGMLDSISQYTKFMPDIKDTLKKSKIVIPKGYDNRMVIDGLYAIIDLVNKIAEARPIDDILNKALEERFEKPNSQILLGLWEAYTQGLYWIQRNCGIPYPYDKWP